MEDIHGCGRSTRTCLERLWRRHQVFSIQHQRCVYVHMIRQGSVCVCCVSRGQQLLSLLGSCAATRAQCRLHVAEKGGCQFSRTKTQLFKLASEVTNPCTTSPRIIRTKKQCTPPKRITIRVSHPTSVLSLLYPASCTSLVAFHTAVFLWCCVSFPASMPVRSSGSSSVLCNRIETGGETSHGASHVLANSRARLIRGGVLAGRSQI